jgi:uncharacterized membrane protein YdjX (TVP38/TMEM64 family)
MKKLTPLMNRNVKKSAILAVILVFAVVFLICDLDRFFTLSYIKASQQKFHAMYSDTPFLMIAGYMAIYIAVTSLSLPGAAVLSLAGGALFGFWVGVIVVSFASTIGATLAGFAARYVLRDWVQQRFEQKLVTVNQEIERQGAFYLFTLRLIPVIPFWIINLVMGLTKMPFRTFYWVSQVGMLPATIVYVNAGKELGKIESLSGILSPGLIISFVILGIFPVTVKKLLALYKIQNQRC